MLVAIDVGNTNINVGVFKGKRLVLLKKIETKKPASPSYYTAQFKKILRNRKIEGIILSSVVPQTTEALKKQLRKISGVKPFILGENCFVPIRNLYKYPRKVGQDRLVNAYAGYKKFANGLIIVDFGTAVTFDVVTKNGSYLGGIIFPGIEMSLNTLSDKAALLPKIRVEKPKSLIGKDTVTSMRSGIVCGYAALCRGLISRIRKEVGKKYTVIFTGGHSKIISGFCKADSIQPNLTIEGLYLLYKFFLTKSPK